MLVYSDITFIGEGVRHRFILLQAWMYSKAGVQIGDCGQQSCQKLFLRGNVLGKDTYILVAALILALLI